MTHELPKLPYTYDALEPWIDARTMEIHHGKHHAAYVAKLNEALAGYLDLQEKPLEELLADLAAVPEAVRTAVRNHGGGHFNHSFFWQSMKPGGLPAQSGRVPGGDLGAAIASTFGDLQKFQEAFSKEAAGQFGSGWVWLARDHEGELIVLATPNQDSPLSQGLQPLLCLDVWEHAYYLKYQNRRAEYVGAFWNIVSWEEAERRFTA